MQINWLVSLWWETLVINELEKCLELYQVMEIPKKRICESFTPYVLAFQQQNKNKNFSDKTTICKVGTSYSKTSLS